MKIISFVTQKGGSGKTTLAVNCAVAAQQAGRKVLLLDLDPQATAEAWYQKRESETPKLEHIKAAKLDEALARARRDRFDVVLVDTAGQDAPSTTAAIRASHLCIIPSRPTVPDMMATPATAETVKRLNKAAAFVLTQTPPRSFRIKEAEKGLGLVGFVAPVHIVQRNAYQDAFAAGLGVTEYEPEGKAAAEIDEFWKWTDKKLGKVRDGE